MQRVSNTSLPNFSTIKTSVQATAFSLQQKPKWGSQMYKNQSILSLKTAGPMFVYTIWFGIQDQRQHSSACHNIFACIQKGVFFSTPKPPIFVLFIITLPDIWVTAYEWPCSCTNHLSKCMMRSKWHEMWSECNTLNLHYCYYKVTANHDIGIDKAIPPLPFPSQSLHKLISTVGSYQDKT